MQYLKPLCAAVLATALFASPFSPVLSVSLANHRVVQESDVPSDAEQAMFTKGQNLYNQARYDQAVVVLNDFLKTYPNSIITDLSLLWLGRSYMQLGRLQDADQIGQRLKAIHDTPFADIYETELQAAKREALARKPSPTPSPELKPVERAQPTQTAVAQATPTPKPPAIAPTETAVRTPPATNRNANTERRVVTPVESASANDNAQARAATGPARRERRQQPVTTTANANVSVPPKVEPTPQPTPAEVAVDMRPEQKPAPAAAVTPTTMPAVEAAAATGGLSLTVRQVPNLLLALRKVGEAASPGQTVQIPLAVTNTGNKEDQFRLETDLPAEFQPTFSLASGAGPDTGLPVLITPEIARNGAIDVLLKLRVPETATDGQQRRFLVRASSQSDYSVMRVADGAITVVAPALTANSVLSSTSVMPGETFKQSIAVRNVGSTFARSSRADFVFNPNFELVSADPAPIAYDRASRTAIWSLGDMAGRDGKEIQINVRASPEALAATTLLGRGTLRTQSLPYASNFDSPSVTVGKVARVRVEAVSPGLTVTPGDTVYIPFAIKNPGNSVDSYELRIAAPGAPSSTIYADMDGDGKRQPTEPAITQTPPLPPRDGQLLVLLHVVIPRDAPDRQQFSYNLVARSLSSNRIASEGNTILTVGTPQIRVRTEQIGESMAPGDMTYYRLVLMNVGAGLAKNIVLTETLPNALQFVSSEPELNKTDAPADSQRFVWRVAELAPGDTAVLRIAVRLSPNLQADTNLTTRHTFVFQDGNGNNYQGR